MTNWVTLTRTVKDPRLTRIEEALDQLGIPHQRAGETWNQPGQFLQVPQEQWEEAHKAIIAGGDDTTDSNVGDWDDIMALKNNIMKRKFGL